MNKDATFCRNESIGRSFIPNTIMDVTIQKNIQNRCQYTKYIQK